MLIHQRANFTIAFGKTSVGIFATSEEKEAFRITVLDYYRLVQRL